MIAPPPRPLSVRASGIAAAFFLGLTGLALPHSAHAQTAPTVDDATKVPVPTVVLHLSAESAAPTRAVLHERMLTGLSVHGAVLAPKEGESHIIRFSPTANDAAATTKALEELGKKHAATHPPLRVPNQNDVEKQKADDAALLTTIAQKSKSGMGFMDFAALTRNMPGASPLYASLTPQQPTEPTGRAHLTFVAPELYDAAKNTVSFKNTRPYIQHIKTLPLLFSPIQEVFTPNSYLDVEMKGQAGKTYLIVAKAFWGTFPFDFRTDTASDSHAIRVSVRRFFTVGAETTIPGGTARTSIAVQCDKDGWYSIQFAGLANEWTFQGLTIKEIEP